MVLRERLEEAERRVVAGQAAAERPVEAASARPAMEALRVVVPQAARLEGWEAVVLLAAEVASAAQRAVAVLPVVAERRQAVARVAGLPAVVAVWAALQEAEERRPAVRPVAAVLPVAAERRQAVARAAGLPAVVAAPRAAAAVPNPAASEVVPSRLSLLLGCPRSSFEDTGRHSGIGCGADCTVRPSV